MQLFGEETTKFPEEEAYGDVENPSIQSVKITIINHPHLIANKPGSHRLKDLS